jgi:hypothetical protein
MAVKSTGFNRLHSEEYRKRDNKTRWWSTDSGYKSDTKHKSQVLRCLMFVPCIIRHSREQPTLHRIVPLLYSIHWLPTCFGSSLPASGSILDPSGLLERQIKQVIYHIMYVYMAWVSECRGSVSCASQLSAYHAAAYVGAYVLNKGVVQFSAVGQVAQSI